MQSTASGRVGLWSTSCLILIALFDTLQGPAGTMETVYRMALLFVLPLWLLFLPICIRVNDAQELRIWTILGSCTLTASIAYAGLVFIQMLNRGNPAIIWQGYPTGPNIAVWMTFAAVAGFIAGAIYGFLLFVARRFSKKRAG